MAKKLLNEATVRRFQSLANLKPINEMSYKRDDETDTRSEEEKAKDQQAAEERHGGRQHYGTQNEAEEPGMDMAPEPEEAPEMLDAEEMDAEEDAMGDMNDVELTDEEARMLIELGEKLSAAMGEDDDMMDAPEADEADEAPEMPMMEEDELMEALSEVDYVPSQAEVVNEVARRVARRLAEAQKAEKLMNEALGRK